MRALALVALALALAGCEVEFDRVSETGDGCTVMVAYAARCQAAGKAAICTHKRPELLRRVTPECVASQ
ncbi:hypothetical protein AA309_20140 [Microvirga vignae]|uniref:Lipoprotein n=1 Tax=Microvirga vignae TaxID=1225564 RepID=A0A0H1R997_9HYPH|nr:hypothetical protein [Microvirga vignae]KLK91411.1 hypothetical protein AA309_20140 [Microvirga vignae]